MRSIFATSLICLALNGCTVSSSYDPPYLEVPSEWQSDGCEVLCSEPPDCFHWWKSLDDPVLESLILRASNQNLDLSIAASRILEVRAEEKGFKTSLYPHLDGTATLGHAQYNQKTLDKILGISSNNKSSHKNLNFFEAGFDVEWELDLFGANAHQMQALQAKIESSEADYCHLWITLTAEIARNYIELRGLQYRFTIISEEINTQSEELLLTEDLARTGFTDGIRSRQSEVALSQLKAQKPLIEISIKQAIHRLSVLLGHSPGVLSNELSVCRDLPVLPCKMPIGIPSELLRRRPDIRKAERDLAAATEMVGNAVASLFPKISLLGFVGDIGAFNSANSFTWFGGPQLLMPIFNSRALQQDVCINEIKVQQALDGYQKVVLEAIEEAENALAAFCRETERSVYIVDALRANRDIFELTLQQYKDGTKSYVEVLEARRACLVAEESYLQSKIDLLVRYVALYKALGGGWDIV